MIPIPDLLHLEPRKTFDWELLGEALGLGFQTGDAGTKLDEALAGGETEASTWDPRFFGDDLFLTELVEDAFQIRIRDEQFPVLRSFLLRVLSAPLGNEECIRFRQLILRELVGDAAIREAVELLYRRLAQLTKMFRAPGDSARLDYNAYRLDILQTSREVIDLMADGLPETQSGLGRLRDVGREIRQTEDYRVLESLLDWVNRKTTLNADLDIGPDGRLKALRIRKVSENRGNTFYRSAWGRNWERLRFFLLRGRLLSEEEITIRLVDQVYDRLSTSLIGLVQVQAHLDVYLASLGFRQRASERGLEVCLPKISANEPARIKALFNPLLLRQELAPVPCDYESAHRHPITVITGPNSGGKTRFIQAVALAQLLGQCGLFAAAETARLPLCGGLFVSLIEREAVDHAEGRLGRELSRIRTLFEVMGSSSMILLDELCSGTNPAEGEEVFVLVLQLLELLHPTAFVTTHFLEFARSVEDSPPVKNMQFLCVEMDELQDSTYQFAPGVAVTSLASVMAERMGVTLERLTRIIDKNKE